MSTQNISLETVDNINRSLSKTISITCLLLNDGQSKDGFQSNHSIIIDAIWDISDHLYDIKKELEITNE